jgi:CRISPR/Cas system CMR-associated protein Cmr5 small subunit
MYILYKNPIQLETLNIVQYLYYNNIIFLPNTIIERNYPHFITELPTIIYNNNIYSGLKQVVSFYETISGIQKLLEKQMNSKNSTQNIL